MDWPIPVPKRQWAVVDTEGREVHVIPIMDICAHVESQNCVCKPKVMQVGEGLLVTHNAFDERPDD